MLSCVGVAENEHAMLGSGEQNVDSIRRLQEARIVPRVATDEGDHNNLGLLALD